MTKQLQAEIQALDRVRYLLEEKSFDRLRLNNEQFADLVEELYARVSREVADRAGPSGPGATI